jgi:hypothetical protein
VVFLLLLLGGCGKGADEPSLRIVGAQFEQRGDVRWLVADCRWEPSEAMIEALEHGIALTLAVRVEAAPAGWFGRTAHSSEQHVELRYFPLTRTYQWRHREDGSMRSYAVRSSALSALERLELPLGNDFGTEERGMLRIALDTAALPGALQLPALLQREWRQPRASYAWPAPSTPP